jgi:hypothetical protein
MGTVAFEVFLPDKLALEIGGVSLTWSKTPRSETAKSAAAH